MEVSILISLETKNLWPGTLGKLDNIDFLIHFIICFEHNIFQEHAVSSPLNNIVITMCLATRLTPVDGSTTS